MESSEQSEVGLDLGSEGSPLVYMKKATLGLESGTGAPVTCCWVKKVTEMKKSRWTVES